MKFMKLGECARWCADHDLPVPSHPRRDPSPDTHRRYDFAIPADAGRRVNLCRVLWTASTGVRAAEQLLWLDEWGVWPSGEYLPLFTTLRAAFGEARSLTDTPGHLFEPADDTNGLSFLIVASLFLWGCWLYTDSGFIIRLSHDEYGIVFDPRSRPATSIGEQLGKLELLK